MIQGWTIKVSIPRLPLRSDTSGGCRLSQKPGVRFVVRLLDAQPIREAGPKRCSVVLYPVTWTFMGGVTG
jgi:hypothetical protein